jgi:NADH dehydrogenase (ubiquinone) 1 alpha subcomplex subunit 5
MQPLLACRRALRIVGRPQLIAPQRFVSTVKATTGIFGLDVVPNAREVLTKLYEKTLKDVQVRGPLAIPQTTPEGPRPTQRPTTTCAPSQIIPADVPYRKSVEAFTNFRLQVVRDNEDVSAPR